MARTSSIRSRPVPVRLSNRARAPAGSGARPAGHEHLTEVACVDVPAGEKRPEFGCFNVGTVTGLHFSQSSVYWHLREFPNRKLRTRPRVRPGSSWRKTGECGSPNSVPAMLPRREVKRSPSSDHCSFPQPRATLRCSLTLSCGPATIPGCIHTRAPKAGTCWRESSVWRLPMAPTGLGPEKPSTVRSNIPMELNVTGTTLRRAFALVIHDSAQPRGTLGLETVRSLQ